MARLNEPVASGETLDSLKRRYLRQNRDVARVNSSQQLKIRGLELEISSLLTENLELRSTIIRQQREIEANKHGQNATQIALIKSQLEDKLQELSSWVASLDLETSNARQVDRPTKAVKRSSQDSPNQKNWRRDELFDEEGRLPPILENKYYPQRTLDAADLAVIFSDPAADTDSPDIGPPPVSQFVNPDPVKIDLPQPQERAEDPESVEMDPVLSVNLEQRRKRKDTGDSSTFRRSSTVQSVAASAKPDTSQPLKTSAKRKLNIRDDEERESAARPAQVSPDEFKYSRRIPKDQENVRPVAKAKIKSSIAQGNLVLKEDGHKTSQPNTVALSPRKALGPKTTNQDVANSPRKASKPAPIVEEIKPIKSGQQKKDSARDKGRDRKGGLPSRSFTEPILQTTEVEPEPETPAGLDLFSPPDSQPSTIRTESRDTPPPSGLGESAEGHRPSRRARASVSYAEPNLRDKMRRPSKALVGAVDGEGKMNRPVTIPEGNESSRKPRPTSVVKVKEEPEAEDAWKSENANSPLSGKGLAVNDMMASSIEQRRGRASKPEAPEMAAESGSDSKRGSEVAKKLKAVEVERGPKQRQSADEDLQKRDIYDFSSSSPVEDMANIEFPKETKKAAGRQSRRASSAVQDMVDNDGHNASESGDSKKPVTERRRQSTLGRSSSVNSSDAGSRRTAEGALKRANSTAALDGSGESDSRTERLAGRRRSMML